MYITYIEHNQAPRAILTNFLIEKGSCITISDVFDTDISVQIEATSIEFNPDMIQVGIPYYYVLAGQITLHNPVIKMNSKLSLDMARTPKEVNVMREFYVSRRVEKWLLAYRLQFDTILTEENESDFRYFAHDADVIFCNVAFSSQKIANEAYACAMDLLIAWKDSFDQITDKDLVQGS